MEFFQEEGEACRECHGQPYALVVCGEGVWWCVLVGAVFIVGGLGWVVGEPSRGFGQNVFEFLVGVFDWGYAV